MARKRGTPAQERPSVRTSISFDAAVWEQLGAYALRNRCTKAQAVARAVEHLCTGYHVRAPATPRQGTQEARQGDGEGRAEERAAS